MIDYLLTAFSTLCLCGGPIWLMGFLAGCRSAEEDLRMRQESESRVLAIAYYESLN